MSKKIKISLMCVCLFIIGLCLSACGDDHSTPPIYPIIPTPIPTPTPTPVAPEIQLSRTLFEINIGDTDNITVTLDGEDVTDEAIYTPDDENIATVEKGLITAHNQGTTIVNVHVEGAKEDKTFTVNVIDPTLPTLELSQNEFDLKVGQTDNITVTLEGEDVTEDVNYTPVDEAIATVDTGIITAISKGSTDVIVSLEGANNAVFTVNVDLSTLELSQDTFALKIGNTSNITVKVDNQDITQSQDITYTPKDPSVATVEKGVITALSKGSTDVTVSFPDAKDATFTVNVDLTDLQLSESKFEMNVDEEAKIKVTCNDKDVTKDVTYTVKVNKTNEDENIDGENIVIVEEGIIKSQYQGGSVTVTVSLEGIANDATFTVNVTDDSVDKVELNKDVYTELYSLRLVDKDYSNRTALTAINIPGTYKDNNGDKHKITSIGKEMFAECTNLKTVTIPNSIKEIKEEAFKRCTALTELVIPDSVKTLGKGVFKECTALTNITLGKGITEIPKNTFKGCSSLTELVIPDNVTTLDKDAFTECTALKTLTLGNGITEIEKRQFDKSKKLSSLETINIGTGVKTIGEKAFTDSSTLTTINISESNKVLTTIKEYAFENCTKLTTISIPNNVADRTEEGVMTTGITIEKYAFSECSALTELDIPDTVTELGDYAFNECSALKTLVIPDSVTELGDFVCWKCASLETLTLGNGITEIRNEQFSNKNRNLNSLVNVTIGTGVKTIGTKAFADCNITAIVIPDNVETIGQEAFTSCTKLTNVTIGTGVKTIETNAFCACGYDKDTDTANLILRIPDQVTTIESNAFRNLKCICYTNKLQITIPSDYWGAKDYEIVTD